MSKTQKKGSTSTTPIPTSTGRPSSPLSPTRHSRLVEKTELQNLNDRLACYIDRVRNLETENSRLILEIKSTRENVTRETSNIKGMYEKELSDARKLLDETAKEKAKLEIDTKRLWEENDELHTKLDKLKKELTAAENSRRLHESRYNDLTGRYNQACNDRQKAQADAKDLEIENERLRKQLEDLRKHLEDETLARVDLENTIQSLREELSFKDNIHEQELSEVRTRRQVEITEIDGRLSQQYEAKLQESLQELREQYEDQMRANRDDIKKLYEDKMQNLQFALDRNSNQASHVIDELRLTRTKIDGLNAKIVELESANGQLTARIRALEKLLDDERIRHGDDVAALEAELSRLREEMNHQLKEYQDLMDIKVSLDLEIAAYDTLLKGEECRLNITPNSSLNKSQFSQSTRTSRSTPARRTPSRQATAAGAAALKRKRTYLDESEDRAAAEHYVTASAKGDIEIIEADPEGRFVKVHNKSNKEVLLGGWQLTRSVGTNEITFKFHRSVKVDGNGTVIVWSGDAGVQHEPPNNLVMKQQKWFVGDNMKTILHNNDGEEVAVSERIKRAVSTHMSRHRSGLGDDSYMEGQGTSGGRSSFWLW